MHCAADILMALGHQHISDSWFTIMPRLSPLLASVWYITQDGFKSCFNSDCSSVHRLAVPQARVYTVCVWEFQGGDERSESISEKSTAAEYMSVWKSWRRSTQEVGEAGHLAIGMTYMKLTLASVSVNTTDSSSIESNITETNCEKYQYERSQHH